MDSDGTNQTRLTFEVGENRLPVWSPNGRQIAFENGRIREVDLFVMDADGNNQRRLTNHRHDDRSPHWHPDGTMIAFIRYVQAGPDEGIYTVDLDGGEPQLVIKAHEIEIIRWSLDGKRIAFTVFFYFCWNSLRLYSQLANHTPHCASFEVFASRIRDNG